ncbi:hypothetical protein VE23_03740 [Paenibacillus sp. D9]|uniref:amino acid permease n=1 Tax=Paenibacillus sp. D9 TaxID=665792 RepID=UPI00061FBD82|nr:amino acid permease [Paenibacillus sp. D9]KKC46425.1 hypothetical protein VE23_03740 [Paenibacillus sp. D9]
MLMWTGFALFCLVAVAWLAAAAAAENGLRRSGYRSMTRYAAYIQFMQDKRELNRLGIPQQLKRAFGPFAAFGVSFNALSLLGGAALFYAYAWNTGSEWLLVWAWPVLGLLALSIHAGQAELMSAVPSAGGSYHAALLLGGKGRGFLTGWLQLGGQISMLAFVNLAAADWMQGLLASWNGWSHAAGVAMLFAVLMLVQLSLCLFGNYGFSMLQNSAALLQIASVAAAIAVMTAYLWPSFGLEKLYSARSLAAAGEPRAVGAGWIMGLLLLYRMFMGSATAEHLSEETVEPRIRLPWGHVLSGAYVYVGGFILLGLAAMALLQLPLGAEHDFFLQAAAPWGGGWRVTAAAAVGVSLCVSGGSVLFAASRLAGSLSRDEALPFSRQLSSIVRKGRTFAWGACAAAACAALLALAAGMLMNAMTGAVLFLLALAIVLQHSAQLIPLVLSMTREGKDKLAAMQPLWSLGRAGTYAKPLAVAALAALMAAAAFAAPAAAAAAAAWLLVSGGMFLLKGRHRYEGMEKGMRLSQEELLRTERYHPQ